MILKDQQILLVSHLKRKLIGVFELQPIIEMEIVFQKDFIRIEHAESLVYLLSSFVFNFNVQSQRIFLFIDLFCFVEHPFEDTFSAIFRLNVDTLKPPDWSTSHDIEPECQQLWWYCLRRLIFVIHAADNVKPTIWIITDEFHSFCDFDSVQFLAFSFQSHFVLEFSNEWRFRSVHQAICNRLVLSRSSKRSSFHDVWETPKELVDLWR